LNHMSRFFSCAILLILILLTEDAFSQLRSKRRSYYSRSKNISNYTGERIRFPKVKRYNSVGVTLSALNYFGDLAPKSNIASTDISFTRPGVGVTFVHRYGPRYSLRGSFMWGRLKGDDFNADPLGGIETRSRYIRNLHFRNDIKELSVVAMFDLFENNGTFYSRAKWTPYAFVGAAVVFHNPKAVAPSVDLNGNPLPEAGEWVDLQPLGTEGQNSEFVEGLDPYNKVVFAIPVGAGVRWRLPGNFDASFEIGYRQLFTDYIDDVSGNYVDLGVFDDELTKALSDRSQEPIAASAEEARNLDIIDEFSRLVTFISEGDGQQYTVLAGYGQRRDPVGDDPGNLRGSDNDNDIYIVAQIQLTYIIGRSFGKAKYR